MEQTNDELQMKTACVVQPTYSEEIDSCIKTACNSAIKCFDLMLKKPSFGNNSIMMHEIIKPYALMGFPRAMICLATTYRLGFGVEKNLHMAKDWYIKAVKKGGTFALVELFKLKYFSNIDVGSEVENQFISIFEKEKDDDVRICKAIMYYDGTLVPKNIDESIQILGRVNKIKDIWANIIYEIIIEGVSEGYPIKKLLDNCLSQKNISTYVLLNSMSIKKLIISNTLETKKISR